ncbi:hypothetical protein L5515_000945 [Caenorhabditis briggsae]|uniref:Uncharacterized protein n=1 Tax=Caenorhabditis briggsae TaxID=6238 RepID=A0AAE9E416_CAEBR|nr:hypothetical protein L5515_000945 [Caenorhabditis briggsae]
MICVRLRTKRFPVNRNIQEEIMEFIKKKLLDSIELQQFLVSREIDFHEKYIDSLANRDDHRNYNNHNDLEEHGRNE